MELEFINKLSNLAFASYFNPSLNKAIVHFFNEQEDKNDIVAYLNNDMSWDVREITDESSELSSLGEMVMVTHKLISVCVKDSDFDKFIRLAIDSLLVAQGNEEESLKIIDERVAEILSNNSY